MTHLLLQQSHNYSNKTTHPNRAIPYEPSPQAHDMIYRAIPTQTTTKCHQGPRVEKRLSHQLVRLLRDNWILSMQTAIWSNRKCLLCSWTKSADCGEVSEK